MCWEHLTISWQYGGFLLMLYKAFFTGVAGQKSALVN